MLAELSVLHDDSGNRYAEDDQKAEALGGFFASVFVRNSDTSCPNLERKTSLGLDDFVIHPSEVLRLLKSLKNLYDCLSGVPQGGVLSPLLFLAYTRDRDLPSLLRTHSSVRVQQYADDIKVYGLYKEEDIAIEAMSRSISNMMEWSVTRGLPLISQKLSYCISEMTHLQNIVSRDRH
ncbi:hypothetical protein COOONC_09096 [Cooperia oncophora]